jgi:hypothetical protein
MFGGAMDTLGMFNDRGGMLGAYLSSRRAGGAVTAARAGSAGARVGVGAAAERWGKSKALKSASEILIVAAAQQADVNEGGWACVACGWRAGGELVEVLVLTWREQEVVKERKSC